MRMQSDQSDQLSGPPHPSKVKYSNHFKASLCRTITPSQSKISSEMPKCQYCKPQENPKTYFINTEHHLQCHQDAQQLIQANTPQDLPGLITVGSAEDLKLYPNSFDRLGSLKGEYNIKLDPSVPLVQHASRKVPIESKAANEEAIDYMVEEGISE